MIALERYHCGIPLLENQPSPEVPNWSNRLFMLETSRQWTVVLINTECYKAHVASKLANCLAKWVIVASRVCCVI